MVPVFLTIGGLYKEIKTENASLLIEFGEYNITIDLDGRYVLPDLQENDAYNAIISSNSNIDSGFECTGIENVGSAYMPFVNIIFICDFRSKSYENFFIFWFKSFLILKLIQMTI